MTENDALQERIAAELIAARARTAALTSFRLLHAHHAKTIPGPSPALAARYRDSQPAASLSSLYSGSSLTTSTVSRDFSSVFCSLRAHLYAGAAEPFSSAIGSPSIPVHPCSPGSLNPRQFINPVLPTNHLFDPCGP